MPLHVSKKVFDNFVGYFRRSGYAITEVAHYSWTAYYAYDSPWYGRDTYIAAHSLIEGRNTYHIYMLLPYPIDLVDTPSMEVAAMGGFTCSPTITAIPPSNPQSEKAENTSNG
jgi:hypothetical protein